MQTHQNVWENTDIAAGQVFQKLVIYLLRYLLTFLDLKGLVDGSKQLFE